MPNIICNSCVGGFIYQNELKSSFNNPFIWALIDFKSMVHLITKYNTLNYYNISIFDNHHNNSANWSFGITIDGCVQVKYIHYIFSPYDTYPRKAGIEIFYDRPWEYMLEKYITRLKRMLLSNEHPIFIFANWFSPKETNLTYEQIGILNNLHTNNIICAVDELYSAYDNIKQIERRKKTNIYNQGLAHDIYETFIK